MDARKMIAVVLILAGALGLAYGGFSYTKEAHHAEIGDMHLTLNESQRVNVPMWASIASILCGGLLFATSGRRIR